MEKKRYEFVDLMKGICIIMVVALHVNVPYAASPVLSLFRMPLFFAISGIFFSRYDSFSTFFKKKTNTLFIPYLFFSIPNLFLILFFYFKDTPGNVVQAYSAASLLFNTPIWFLLSLYTAGLIFYLISGVKSGILKFLIVIFISAIGYWLNKNHISLPLYLNSTFNAFIFYYWGYLVKRIGILTDSRYIRIKLLVAVALFIVIVCFVLPVPFLSLSDITNMPYFYFISCATCGILSIFYLSKCVNKFRGISFIGRYSIIILGTHLIWIRLFGLFVPYRILSHPLSLWAVFVFILLTAYPMILFLINYFPKYCAQKPLLK